MVDYTLKLTNKQLECGSVVGPHDITRSRVTGYFMILSSKSGKYQPCRPPILYHVTVLQYHTMISPCKAFLSDFVGKVLSCVKLKHNQIQDLSL